jgi:hypothetical protein
MRKFRNCGGAHKSHVKKFYFITGDPLRSMKILQFQKPCENGDLQSKTGGLATLILLYRDSQLFLIIFIVLVQKVMLTIDVKSNLMYDKRL